MTEGLNKNTCSEEHGPETVSCRCETDVASDFRI